MQSHSGGDSAVLTGNKSAATAVGASRPSFHEHRHRPQPRSQRAATMAQPLTPFYPIFPCKSDGQDVVNQKGAPLRNGPTEEQLDRTPNEQGQSDYYRLIDKDEPKHIDWRKKLGGMLLREIGGKQHEGGHPRSCIPRPR